MSSQAVLSGGWAVALLPRSALRLRGRRGKAAGAEAEAEARWGDGDGADAGCCADWGGLPACLGNGGTWGQLKLMAC